ncbi:MAG: flagellin lysine-N-methylase [Holophaga sp.]|nr:flagellin lysine-N-methylase [Holophaga sp.]
MPAYVSRFSCIGGECEDTCCGGWGIPVDQDSFLYYQSCLDPVLQPLIAKHVKRNSESNSHSNYGHLELTKDHCRCCGFLTDKKLCLIQERLGAKALSDTCANYPRTISRFGDMHQMTLTLSCPEAARLALLYSDAFDLVGQVQTVSQTSVSRIKSVNGLPLSAMDDVRTLVVQILRSQEISLSNRLKLIGIFCERLTELLNQKRMDSLPQLIQDQENDLESGAAMASLTDHAELLDVQAQIPALFFLGCREGLPSPHLRRVLDEAAKGLGIGEGLPPDGPALVRAYEQGLPRLNSALKAVPWLLEHYLLNEMLREYFPWASGNPIQRYSTFILRFAITRLLLVGRAAAQETLLTPAELAETIQVSCRHFLHDDHLTKKVEQSLRESDWNGLERLHSLL